MRIKISHGTPLYLTNDIRGIESKYQDVPLMERAGLAVATLARQIAADSGKPVLIFAGPGNNGGDAFVAARYLRQWFFPVLVVFGGEASTLPRDAAAAYTSWQETGGVTQSHPPASGDYALVIDGLFGIGLSRDIAGRYEEWINCINTQQAPVLAIDIPSGLDADSGCIHGCCVRATQTITFIGAKPGLLTLDGPDHCGEITVDDLDLNHKVDNASGQVLGATTHTLSSRLRNTHKGSCSIARRARGNATRRGTRVCRSAHAQSSPA
jgi:hydroxyethylthiazole kinase-like uncharacterized protein yjeF